MSPRDSLWKRTSTTVRPSPGASYTEGWLTPANGELHHTGEIGFASPPRESPTRSGFFLTLIIMHLHKYKPASKTRNFL